MKVIAIKTCYTSDNKRKREGQIFNIKKEDFSFSGMALYMGKGKEPKKFDNFPDEKGKKHGLKELEAFLAKPQKEEIVEDLEIIEESESDESCEDVSNQEVI